MKWFGRERKNCMPSKTDILATTNIVKVTEDTHKNIDQANTDIKKLKDLLKADGFAFKISVATGHKHGH